MLTGIRPALFHALFALICTDMLLLKQAVNQSIHGMHGQSHFTISLLKIISPDKLYLDYKYRHEAAGL